MAGNDAEFKTFVDARQAEAEIVKLHKRIDQLSGRLKGAGKTSKAAADEGSRGWKQFNATIDRAIGRHVSLQAGISAVQRGFRAALGEGKRFAEMVQRAADVSQEQELKLAIQAGLTPAQVEKNLPAIRRALITTPSETMEGGYLLQTQLASSGFRREDIDSGEALKAVLDLKAATNLFGKSLENPKEAVLSISQTLKALGESEPSAKSVRRLGGKLTELFAFSDVQFADLSALAGKAAALKTKNMDENLQLAAFGALREALSPEEAATALDQVTVNLRSAAAMPKSRKALGRLGLKPDDVDLIGETLPEAMDKLKTALSKVDPKTGSLAMIDIFGERAEKSAQTMLTQNETTKRFLELMKGGGFERNVAMFQESVFARRRRDELDTQFMMSDRAKAGGGLTWEEVRGDIDQAYTSQLKGAGKLERLKLLGGLAYDRSLSYLYETFLHTPNEVGLQPTDVRGKYGIQPNNHVMRHEEKNAMQEQTDVLKGILNSVQQNRPAINRNAHTE